MASRNRSARRQHMCPIHGRGRFRVGQRFGGTLQLDPRARPAGPPAGRRPPGRRPISSTATMSDRVGIDHSWARVAFPVIHHLLVSIPSTPRSRALKPPDHTGLNPGELEPRPGTGLDRRARLSVTSRTGPGRPWQHRPAYPEARSRRRDSWCAVSYLDKVTFRRRPM